MNDKDIFIISPCYTLTDAGNQISKIIKVESNFAAFENFVEILKKENPTMVVKLANIN